MKTTGKNTVQSMRAVKESVRLNHKADFFSFCFWNNLNKTKTTLSHVFGFCIHSVKPWTAVL